MYRVYLENDYCYYVYNFLCDDVFKIDSIYKEYLYKYIIVFQNYFKLNSKYFQIFKYYV